MFKELLHTKLQVLAFLLVSAVCALAFVAWASTLHWRFSAVSAYALFPLLGLIAFSILWSQYVLLVLLKLSSVKSKSLSTYFTVTGWLFLAAIFLHPSILIWQLWRDGFGLPPESYLRHYVAPGLEWAALLGTVSFLTFVAYESRRWLKDRSWWKWVAYASDVAALAIFIHSFKLGTTVQTGWFHYLWIFYGFTLAGSLFYLRLLPLLKSNA